MKYWLFNCNPKIWEIDEFLSSGTIYSTWKINESHKNKIKKGDLGFIRVGHDKRLKKQLNGRNKLERGIYAIVQVTHNPEIIDDKGDQYWLIEEKKNEVVWRVQIKYIMNLIDNPVLISNFDKANEIEKKTAVLNGQQTITAEVTKSDFDIILDNCKSSQNEIDLISKENLFGIDDIARLELKYKDATPKIKERVSKQIERGEIANTIKRYYNYDCLICKELGLPSKGFLKRNNEYYVETHHFFPVSTLKKGTLGIGNLMTLCANHHKEIHYGMIDSIESNELYFLIKINGKQIKIKKKSR